MTESMPPPTPSPVSTAMPATRGRPGLVTAAGVTLIVLGAITLLIGVILLLGVAIFAGAAGGAASQTDLPGLGSAFGAFAGAIFVVVIIVVGFGALQLVSGIKVLSGASWARITGIVVAAIAGLLALAGIGNADGAVLNVALVAANAFVIYVLAVSGSWFTRSPG